MGKEQPRKSTCERFHLEMVQAGRSKQDVSQEIIDQFAVWGVRRREAVFICQNPSFDRAFFSQLIDPDTQNVLDWPYHWLDLASMFWAISLQKTQKTHAPPPWDLRFSKDSIAMHYHLPPEEKPHRAMQGVDHLLLCYKAVVGFPGKMT